VTDGNVADQNSASITVAVTAPGRVGASRLDAECARCGATERRYVPRGTVSVEHVCGDGWRLMPKDLSATAG
jgi:hypothetical protein